MNRHANNDMSDVGRKTRELTLGHYRLQRMNSRALYAFGWWVFSGVALVLTVLAADDVARFLAGLFFAFNSGIVLVYADYFTAFPDSEGHQP